VKVSELVNVSELSGGEQKVSGPKIRKYGQGHFQLSRILANVKNLDKNYTTVENWTFIPNQLPNIVANIPVQLCVGGF